MLTGRRLSARALLWVPAVTMSAMIVAVLIVLLDYSLGYVSVSADAGGSRFALYRALLSSSSFHRTIMETLWLAGIVTALCNVMGFPLARTILLTPSPSLRRSVLLGLFAVLMSGAVTRGYAWMLILDKRGLLNAALVALHCPPARLNNSMGAVVVTMTSVTLPFYVLTLFGALKNVTPEIERAAANLGATSWQRLRHVVLPLAAPGLVAANTVCFSLSLGAFLYPELLGGGRVRVLATAIYEDVQTAYDVPRAAAMSVLFLSVALLLRSLLAVSARWAGDGR